MILLPTDALMFLLWAAAIGFFIWASSQMIFQKTAREMLKNPLAIVSILIISVYALVGLLDSFHYQPYLLTEQGESRVDNAGKPVLGKIQSVLDITLAGVYKGIEIQQGVIRPDLETGYSSPLSDSLFQHEIHADPQSGKLIASEKKLNHPSSHWLGTDQAGVDVLYLLIKGTRTAILVGVATTILVIPLAVLMGIFAGWYGGLLDDLIQYLYTTMSSIPSILLIASLAMIIDAKVEQGSTMELLHADEWKLFWLCVVMGVLGWTGLCRLIRAETLKLRELDYIQAAKVLGSSDLSILTRHILPNVMPLVLIQTILSFSGQVMTIVILAYLNIGIPSGVYSWGRIINNAKAELAREPMILWPVIASFFALFLLILAVNYIGDLLRDALDPRLRKRT